MLLRQSERPSGPLTVRVSNDGNRTTISLAGELDLATVDFLKRQLEPALADASWRLVVIDMEALEFIDSSGIAVLVQALERDSGSGRLRIVPSRALGVRKVLDLTGLSQRLQTLAAA